MNEIRDHHWCSNFFFTMGATKHSWPGVPVEFVIKFQAFFNR